MKKQYPFFNAISIVPVKIKPEYYWEVIAETLVPNHYLTEVQRQNFKLIFHNTLAYSKEGNLLNGKYLYVLLLEDDVLNCYITNSSVLKNHSYLSAGRPVMAAGILNFSDGNLTCVSNESGHYKPTMSEIRHALGYFFINSMNRALQAEIHAVTADNSTVTVQHYSVLELLMTPEIVKPQNSEEVKKTRFVGHPKNWRAKQNIIKLNQSAGYLDDDKRDELCDKVGGESELKFSGYDDHIFSKADSLR